VTATALLALAEAHQPRIVLFGRTPLTEEPAALSSAADEAAVSRALIDEARRQGGALPTPAELRAAVARVLDNREIKANLQALRQAGSTVRYVAADVRDSAALKAALADVRQEWGPVTGIVHGAGVLADKHIADKTDEQFSHVFDTKVRGLRSLLAATADDPISFLCVFSSVAARYGNAGQSDYAMANEVLTQVASAQRRERPDCVVRSIAWGPWRGGMVTPHLEAHFQQRGVPLIELDAGARAFAAECAASGPDVAVVVTAPGETDPLGGPRPIRDLAEIRVNSRSHGYLADHDIAGTPVVPIAMALEWMAAAAAEALADGGPIALADINVYRKIALDRFGNGGHRLRVRGGHDQAPGASTPGCSAPGNATKWLELVGDNDAPHYRASVVTRTSAAEPSSWTVALEPVDRAQIYDGHVLFHGPRFHAIHALEGVSAAGAAATVVGARERGWGEEHWRTDPLAVDGGLQLALLWAERALGHASLPMGIGEYRVHRSGLVDTPVRCVVRAREVRDAQAVCDIALIDADQSVRAELLGVSLVRRPS
jgi:NADP-dependent 3-hydroxy acid dehydrogenase YdfG